MAADSVDVLIEVRGEEAYPEEGIVNGEQGVDPGSGHDEEIDPGKVIDGDGQAPIGRTEMIRGARVAEAEVGEPLLAGTDEGEVHTDKGSGVPREDPHKFVSIEVQGIRL